jgi:hypothetical protein
MHSSFRSPGWSRVQLISLMLVDILWKLEEVTNLRIPAGKVQANDMDTVELMLAMARRVGKPKP